MSGQYRARQRAGSEYSARGLSSRGSRSVAATSRPTGERYDGRPPAKNTSGAARPSGDRYDGRRPTKDASGAARLSRGSASADTYDRRSRSGRASPSGRLGASGSERSPQRGAVPARSRYTTLVWAIVVVVLAFIAWRVIASRVYVIRNMEVEGNSAISDEDVIRLSRVEFGAPMSGADEASIRRNIENGGTLAFVSLQRRFPDTLVLTVRERTRDAYIQQAGKLVVLDSDGYVVEVTDSQPQSIPYVTGFRPAGYYLGRQLDTADGRVAAMQAVLEAAKVCGATPKIAMIDLTELSDLRIQTHSGMTVLLGNATNMVDKISFMTGALEKLESEGGATGTLDVAGGDKADHSPLATPTPAPTATPEPTPLATEAAEG